MCREIDLHRASLVDKIRDERWTRDSFPTVEDQFRFAKSIFDDEAYYMRVVKEAAWRQTIANLSIKMLRFIMAKNDENRTCRRRKAVE